MFQNIEGEDDLAMRVVDRRIYLDAEPTNAIRAQRIDALVMAYSTMMGEGQCEVDVYVYELASLVTDIRHWCDREGIDFYKALDVSYQHYLEERQEVSPALGA